MPPLRHQHQRCLNSLHVFIHATIAALSINDSTVSTYGCVTMVVGSAYVKSASNSKFAVILAYGVGICETVDYFVTTKTVNRSISDDVHLVGTIGLLLNFALGLLCFIIALRFQSVPSF